MTAPGIELRWGGGFEEKESRGAVRGDLKTCSEIAVAGLKRFGLELRDRKYLVAHRLAAGERGVYGYTSASKTLHVNVREKSQEYSPRRKEMAIAGTLFHELVHCLRLETTPYDNLLEVAATEGLAYNLEFLFRRETSPWYRWPGVVQKIQAMPKEDIETIRKSFFAIAMNPDSWTDELHREWIGKTYRHKMGKGEIVGIEAVYRQLVAEREIPELMKLPATVLLAAE